MSQSTANLGPEDLERFASLFVPIWDQPPEVPAGPDPGFKAAPLGVQGSLRSSRLCLLEGEAAAVGPMFDGMAEVMRSEDAAEGVRSFVERREAVFKGR